MGTKFTPIVLLMLAVIGLVGAGVYTLHATHDSDPVGNDYWAGALVKPPPCLWPFFCLCDGHGHHIRARRCGRGVGRHNALGIVAECCALPEAVWRRAYASKVTDS